MAMAYDPQARIVTPRYAVTTSGTDQLFIPGQAGRGDNADSGTVAQRRAQTLHMGGDDDNITNTANIAADIAGA